MSFERLMKESRWSQCYYAYLTGGEPAVHRRRLARPLWARCDLCLLSQCVRGLRETWTAPVGFSKMCRSFSRGKTTRLSSLLSKGWASLLFTTLSPSPGSASQSFFGSCVQAERLRKTSPTRELCILGVIEVLYLWKALQNCSSSKLQIMNQGERGLCAFRSQPSRPRIPSSSSLLSSISVTELRRSFLQRPETPPARLRAQMSREHPRRRSGTVATETTL